MNHSLIGSLVFHNLLHECRTLSRFKPILMVISKRLNEVCLQVWFQNKRSKERRLKQLTSMGRGPFFGGSRKMRGFPMNLSPGGLDEPPPGFPYFATADGKFEFGYGGPGGFPHEFFPGHHPHGQPLPFSPQGKCSLQTDVIKTLYMY